METKLKEYEENRQLQNRMIKQLEHIVESLKKDKFDLAEDHKAKDEIIHNLKRKGNVCSNGCDKYNKSIEEVIHATTKHRETAITLKDVCEKQKKKIKEYAEEIDNYENDLSEHEEKIKQLEEDVEIGYGMNDRKRKEIDKLNKEIIEYKKKVLELHNVITMCEKKKDISDRVIENLQHNKDMLEHQLKENKKKLEEKDIDTRNNLASNQEEEIQKLQAEKEELQKENEEKMEKLEQISKECEDFKEMLVFQETRNDELEFRLESQKSEENRGTSLSIELGMSSLCLHSLSFECDKCKQKPEESLTLKHHVRISHEKKQLEAKAIEVENQVHNQMILLSTSLFKLKEMESKEQQSCKCKNFCRIYHPMHNWTRSASSDIIMKWRASSDKKLFPCDQCDTTFESVGSLKNHKELNHL